MFRKITLAILGFCLFCSGPGFSTDFRPTPEVDLGRVLIVFFSLTGSTQRLARILRLYSEGNLAAIVPSEPYDLESVRSIAKTEITTNYRPPLASPIPTVDDYDLVIIGAPVWFGDIPPPLAAVLDKCDFLGKPVAVFCTFNGSAGDFLSKFRENIKNANIISEGKFSGITRRNNANLNAIALSWLKSIAEAFPKQ
ncbi:MAG: NAD(P)H-dependent oxidoreductase [Planctomycetota bacterium]|jgi:flavodoxin|nr:NAD(P)H-dependent oxidoreductase [Planctomycetota bacterium]